MIMNQYKYELFDQLLRVPRLIKHRRKGLTLREYEEKELGIHNHAHPNDAVLCIGGKKTNTKNQIGFVKED